MTEIEYEDVLIRTCDRCGGEFIGADGLAHIVRTREERFPPEMTTELSERAPSFGANDERSGCALACPACSQEMSVGNYGGDSGVYIDRCDGCGGVWLDRDELEHLQVLSERWADEAPERMRGVAGDLELARRRAAEATNGAFTASRFAFVNALMNRFLDAA
jgi:Zn-finger nucleic acid-binding protein